MASANIYALLFGLLATLKCQVADYVDMHRKFEYKHSFKGPNLSQKDGTIPFWEIHGDAIASAEQLRLAPSIRSKMGVAFNNRAFIESEWWEVEVDFRVTGQGRIGADGLAFWYTANKGTLGPVFGSNQHWTGLGIFFDSFDNDARRNNPYISAMVNDGTRAYDHNTDGSNQELAGCQRDFRNRPFPVKARIEYVNNILSLFLHDGMTPQDRFDICFRAERVFLPKNGYFGVSAATGGLADDHDVLAVLTSSYKPKAQVPAPGSPIPETEQKKFDEEFQKYWQEFEQEKEKFKKEHPDKAKPDEVDPSKLYEGAMERELRLIYEGQNSMYVVLDDIRRRLEQVATLQNTHSDMISRVQSGAAGGVPQVAQGSAPVQGDASQLQRHEINELLSFSREASTVMRELKSYVVDIHAKASSLEQRAQQGVGVAVPAGGGQGGGGGGASDFYIVKAELDQIKGSIEQVRINQRNPRLDCPNSDCNCLSATFFFLGIATQTIIYLIYSIWTKGSEKAKFY